MPLYIHVMIGMILYRVVRYVFLELVEVIAIQLMQHNEGLLNRCLNSDNPEVHNVARRTKSKQIKKEVVEKDRIGFKIDG